MHDFLKYVPKTYLLGTKALQNYEIVFNCIRKSANKFCISLIFPHFGRIRPVALNRAHEMSIGNLFMTLFYDMERDNPKEFERRKHLLGNKKYLLLHFGHVIAHPV